MIIFDSMKSKNKKILAELRKAAFLLPVYQKQQMLPMSGSEILKQNPDTKDENGNSLKSSATYIVPVLKPVNHYRVMKDLLNKYGIAAVDKYVLEMAEVANNAVKGESEVIGGLQDRMKSFAI